ncbi:hypothetical protein OGAPHI_003462 [Ogataea philodendri]|uniref:Uncharacterized protein n=1 Tax=Ogataea philodendri TaxID=1378263 RepID=A0A9P8T561_9ASCO|nr:uncharacterized protein OGAPHI_003462 [Ogataea philodendri]KAH3666466.1 hypothetical protein OGAPHI_003462 [Ogataea philodendri]
MYNVWACGSNGNCQLGLEDDKDRDQLEKVNFRTPQGFSRALDEKPVKIACGGNHTLILMHDGSVYGCGSNESGQISSSQLQAGVFEKLEMPYIIKDVVATWESSVFVTQQDQIYVCGKGLSGELGLGKSCTQAGLTKLDLPETGRIVKIESSLHNVVVELENGTLIGFGNNKKGQLLEGGAKLVWTPTKLPTKARQFSLARDFAVYLNDSLKIQGKDQFQIASTAQQLDVKEVQQIRTMWSSVHLITNTALMSIGNNSHGQHFPGFDSSTTISSPTYAIGSEHGLVASDSKVFAWGWGEHGNCGRHRGSLSGVTFDYLNQIYSEPQPVVEVFAGCATSWVITRSTC